MSFEQSSSNISLIDDSILYALCRNYDQDLCESKLDLNNHVGNIDGNLTWGKGAFSHSSKDISLNGTILSAQCQNSDGFYVYSELDLSPLVANSNGNLVGLN